MKFLFSADLHGNEAQYKTLFAYTRENDLPLIIGGDLAPKGEMDSQERFYTAFLQPLLEQHSGAVFLIMGNDDARVHEQLLQRICERAGAHYLHMRRVTHDGMSLAGYACVNITPFGIKDWEKKDVVRPSDRARAIAAEKGQQPLRLRGVRSTPSGWEAADLSESSESLGDDLARTLFTNLDIAVLHAPPAMTALDMIAPGTHVGSVAVREYIETQQPRITLHGHIHETVRVSGAFHDVIGATHCYAPGNDHETGNVAAVVVDTDAPGDGKRLLL